MDFSTITIFSTIEQFKTSLYEGSICAVTKLTKRGVPKGKIVCFRVDRQCNAYIQRLDENLKLLGLIVDTDLDNWLTYYVNMGYALIKSENQ